MLPLSNQKGYSPRTLVEPCTAGSKKEILQGPCRKMEMIQGPCLKREFWLNHDYSTQKTLCMTLEAVSDVTKSGPETAVIDGIVFSGSLKC